MYQSNVILRGRKIQAESPKKVQISIKRKFFYFQDDNLLLMYRYGFWWVRVRILRCISLGIYIGPLSGYPYVATSRCLYFGNNISSLEESRQFSTLFTHFLGMLYSSFLVLSLLAQHNDSNDFHPMLFPSYLLERVIIWNYNSYFHIK